MAKGTRKQKAVPANASLEGDAGRPQRRKARLKRMAEANKATVILETDVRKFVVAQAKAAGMDVNHYLQKVVENHVIAAAPAGDALAERLAAKRAVLDRAVELARQVDAEGGFDEDFILTVMRRAAGDSVFQAAYGKAVDPDAKGPRSGAALNQQLGRLIKRVAGAKSKRNDDGKIQRAQTQGELISTYTLLQRAA